MLEEVLIILSIVLCISIILTGFFQKGSTEGLSGALTGGTDLSLFAEKKERGAEKTLSILMATQAILLVLCLIALGHV